MMMVWKVVLFLWIVSFAVSSVQGRSRRKKRQYSSASYYISNVNPYAHGFIPVSALTYPSGSFYNAPNNINSETLYNGAGTVYDANFYWNKNNNNNLNQYAQTNPYGNVYNSNAGLPAMSNALYGDNLYGWGPLGFNNRYPGWGQGNSGQYYTGGTGTGLQNNFNYNYWDGVLDPTFQAEFNDNLNPNLNPRPAPPPKKASMMMGMIMPPPAPGK